MPCYLFVDSTTLTPDVFNRSLVFTILYLYLSTFLKSNVNNRLIKLFLCLYYLILYMYKYCVLLKSNDTLTVSLPIV
jgi:hypothetical protein